MTEKNTFLVFDPDYPLKSALEIPDGRDTYVNYMLEHERQSGIEDGYTEDENKQLYSIQFDEALAYRLLENDIITREIYELAQDGANYRKGLINKARFERRQASKKY